MNCESCQHTISDESRFCNYCGAKQKLLVSKLYSNPFGTWKVTIAGDCEDGTQLGTYIGYVDEIARALAPLSSGYSLQFTRVEPPPLKPSNRKAVNVSFDIESKTWDLTASERAKMMAKVFKDRPVTIQEVVYHAAFTIKFKD